MSVPPGERTKSPMQFVETADQIEDKMMRLSRRWPKSWYFTITQRTVNLASEIYENATSANSIIPQTEAERRDRIAALNKALGATHGFARKIERAFSLFPICGEKSKASEQELLEKSGQILEEFMKLCAIEEDSLMGNLNYTRSLKFKKREE